MTGAILCAIFLGEIILRIFAGAPLLKIMEVNSLSL